ncbi:MAG TPA: Ig-like domain-containing protein [Gemmatimonadaceae bacterium]
MGTLGGTTACGDAAGPKAGPPASLTVVSGSTQTAAPVTTKLSSPLVVQLTDAQGQPVPGVTVTWTTTSGTLSPLTSKTDRDGQASTQWTLGQFAGLHTTKAKVEGLVTANFTQRVIAGPLTQIIISRDTVRLLAVGDAFRFNARPSDQYGNLVSGGSVVKVADTTVVNAINFGNGATLIARALDSKTTLIATAGPLTASASVIVLAPPCAGGAKILNLAVGEVVSLSGSDAAEFCLQPGSADADFVAMPFYSDFTGAFVRMELSPTGTTTASVTTPGNFSTDRSFDRRGQWPRRDEGFELALRERSRDELTSHMASARLARDLNGGRFSTSSAPLQVGALVQLNVNSSAGCTNATIKTGRVAAITNKAIVVADTTNPPGGFTPEDYRYFGVTFDTLIYPVDVENFGEPSDIDNNQHVILFFTRAVNELTPPNQSFYVGGYFYGRDLFPREKTGGIDPCPASNQAEMFYLLVPDPEGDINQNPRANDFVRTVTIGTLAHEFQHLINSSRHLYANAATNVFEETFLDEGLAHVAEELAFYRSSGLRPQQNIDAVALSSQKASGAFDSFGVANMRRFREYLLDPSSNSPYANNANLTTRGATWSFLRYAADRRGGVERDMWYSLVNTSSSSQHGVANLIYVLGNDFGKWVRDWTTANFADDLVGGISSAYTHPSWNYRSVIGKLEGQPFPLPTQRLDSSVVSSIGIDDGSAAYLRFGVHAGTIGGARLTVRGGTPTDAFSISLLRTR